MRNAIKELKLNSDETIPMFNRTTRTINVYFKGPTGKPIRRRSRCSRGDGRDVLSQICKQNNISMNKLNEFKPSVYADHVSFVWPKV